jgi:hypothetical protein
VRNGVRTCRYGLASATETSTHAPGGGAATPFLETAGIVRLRVMAVAAVVYIGHLGFVQVRSVALAIITALLIGSVLQPLAGGFFLVTTCGLPIQLGPEPAENADMFGPQTASGPPFGRTSTRSRPCPGSLDPFTAVSESECRIEGPEQMLRRLDAELQAWLNHPSASTWSLPPKDRD